MKIADKEFYCCFRERAVPCGHHGTDPPRRQTEPAEQTALGHELKKTEAAAPTVTSAGNIEYWTCARCGRQFFDEAGAREVKDPDELILPTLEPEPEAGCPLCGRTHGSGLIDRLTGWLHLQIYRVRSFFGGVC